MLPFAWLVIDIARSVESVGISVMNKRLLTVMARCILGSMRKRAFDGKMLADSKHNRLVMIH